MFQARKSGWKILGLFRVVQTHGRVPRRIRLFADSARQEMAFGPHVPIRPQSVTAAFFDHRSDVLVRVQFFAPITH